MNPSTQQALDRMVKLVATYQPPKDTILPSPPKRKSSKK